MLAMDFLFIDNFPDLSVEQIERASEAARDIFYGVRTLWRVRGVPSEVAERKRELCYQLLTAWQLAMWFPQSVEGVAINGGLPLQSKSIKNISLSFLNIVRQGTSLAELQLNPFGVQALEMIQSAPENFMLFR
jgi:hypothetical protein